MKKRQPRSSHEQLPDQTPDDPEVSPYGRDSKTRIKLESQALQDLGWSLTQLSGEQLALFDLDDELREAVQLGARIRDHGAIKRHKKFLGKLLRNIDADPVRERYEAVLQDSRQDVQLMHRLEKIRDQMLNDGEEAVNQFMGLHPDADRQKLRQLVKDAGREHAGGQPPVSARKLYRYLRDLLRQDQDEAADQ